MPKSLIFLTKCYQNNEGIIYSNIIFCVMLSKGEFLLVTRFIDNRLNIMMHVVKNKATPRDKCMRCHVDAFIFHLCGLFKLVCGWKFQSMLFQSYAFNRKMSWDYAIQVQWTCASTLDNNIDNFGPFWWYIISLCDICANINF